MLHDGSARSLRPSLVYFSAASRAAAIARFAVAFSSRHRHNVSFAVVTGCPRCRQPSPIKSLYRTPTVGEKNLVGFRYSFPTAATPLDGIRFLPRWVAAVRSSSCRAAPRHGRPRSAAPSLRSTNCPSLHSASPSSSRAAATPPLSPPLAAPLHGHCPPPPVLTSSASGTSILPRERTTLTPSFEQQACVELPAAGEVLGDPQPHASGEVHGELPKKICRSNIAQPFNGNLLVVTWYHHVQLMLMKFASSISSSDSTKQLMKFASINVQY
nr:uncharacterized protein LOC127315841 [Lolium perenne]